MGNDLKLFFRYAAPSMFGMLIAGSYSIVDTVFIGRGVGENGLAAVALTWPFILVLWAIGDLIGSGAGIVLSQERGAGNEREALRVFGNMLTLLAIAAIVFGIPAFYYSREILSIFGANGELFEDALSYSKIIVAGIFLYMLMSGGMSMIRNDGSPIIAMWIMVAGLLGNMFLDWLFIMVFEWGTGGAAFATVLSQFMTLFLIVPYFLFSKTKLKLMIEDLLPTRKTVSKILITGIPVFGGIFAIIAMLFMHNIQSLKYGGICGLAAYTMVSGLESLGSMLLSGLAIGIQPIIAFLYGAKQTERQYRIARYGYVAAFLIGIVMMIFCFLLRSQLPVWTGLSGETAQLAEHGVLLSSTAFLLLGVVRVAAAYYQSSGKILDSALIIYGDAFAALPLCLFTLPIFWGMDGVWLAMPISRVMLFVLVIYIWKSGHSRKCMEL